ncbi:MAG: type ISP restriction/modification enzyme [Bryobacteraceae bacterium]
MSTPLEDFLADVRVIRFSGAAVPETSYYPALHRLFEAIGKTLKPRVRCIMNPGNQGAGLPDGGFYTADQISRSADGPPAAPPARGVIEVKPPSQDAWLTADGEQVTRYWGRYRQVLVTNLRDWVLVGVDADGRQAKLEACRLAGSEREFWMMASTPRAAAAKLEESFLEFLKRVMLHNAELDSPVDLAYFLASYAREARYRVEQGNLPALRSIRSALEEGLGMRFESQKGEHFFRSTLVQTLFYGMFSAWVLWHRSTPLLQPARFDWRLSHYYLRIPILRKLFHEVSDPGQLAPTLLPEVLDWACAALNRVNRPRFFAVFDEGHAVQYFYEPFLEAFDPELRKQLGVWYTPQEVVRYMVARVDTVLRSELGIEDGLADDRVYVLDPCCGTGAFLVEVIHRIADTLREKGGDALIGSDLKKAAIQRVFGFELLPAPFVVAHLQLGLLLESLGAPFSEEHNERAGVFLTNALTGWEPPQDPKPLPFTELEEERDAAGEVKREKPILVILGNPPYNSFAGIAAVEEERGLSEAYRTAKRAPAPQGQGLNDLYVRFFRMAERRIVEKTRKGVVCLISNYSWLDGLSFTGMRERYLEVFDRIWIDCLNGDKYKTGKVTPEGEPDPSVFSTEFNREGIQVGTAIALMVRFGKGAVAGKTSHSRQLSKGNLEASATVPSVQFRHFWGKEKRAELAKAVASGGGPKFETVVPQLRLGLPFMRTTVGGDYLSWPLLPELLPVSFPGVKTSRDDVVVDIDRARLVERMEAYFDPAVSHEEMRRRCPGAMESTARFRAEETRGYLIKRGLLRKNIVRFCYRPFDIRWLYWEPETKLLDEKRSEYFPHVHTGNIWLEARQRQPMDAFDRGYLVKVLADNFGNGLSSFFPLIIRNSSTLPGADQHVENLSPAADGYLESLGVPKSHLFYHAAAIMHSPAYRAENAGALRQDWPRIPLPANAEVLRRSACLGQELATLLDPETPAPQVSQGRPRAELRPIAVVSAVSGTLNPDADLEVAARWGYAGRGGVTMPATGKAVEREYGADELELFRQGCGALSLSLEDLLQLLGPTTFDVYLNDRAYWRNIPAKVWTYTLGGYQVIKKWLSYREKAVLGRPITVEEARHVTATARRIAAILLMGPALDSAYQAARQDSRESA